MASEPVPGIRQQRLAHSKAFYFEDERTLLDTGPESERETMLSFLDVLPGVDRLVLSHNHGDHVGNVDAVVEAVDPEVLVPANEPGIEGAVPAVDRELTDGDSVVGGLVAREVPGHTPGIVGLQHHATHAFVATDIIDGSDRRGLPPGYLLPPPGRFNWDHGLAEANLERLRKYEFDAILVTHGTNVLDEPAEKLERYVDFTTHFRASL